MASMSPAARALLDHPLDCCRWPLGDPEAPGFHWCSRKATAGPYCAAHHRRSIEPEHKGYGPELIARMLRWRPMSQPPRRAA